MTSRIWHWVFAAYSFSCLRGSSNGFSPINRELPFWGLKGSQGSAIRALPVDPTARKAPHIIFHACVTDLKTARTGPAKGPIFSATAAPVRFFLAISFFVISHWALGIGHSDLSSGAGAACPPAG